MTESVTMVKTLADAAIGDSALHRLILEAGGLSTGAVHEHYVSKVEILVANTRQTWEREIGGPVWTRAK